MPASSGAAAGTASASSRAVGRAGVASTTASASISSATRVGPDHETPAAVGAGRELADRGAGAHRRARTWVATASGSRPTPPTIPAKTGYVGRGGPSAAAAASHQRRCTVEQRDHLRHGGAGGQLAGVAGVDATEQRLDQPVDDLLAEPLLDQPPTLTSSSSTWVAAAAAGVHGGACQPGRGEHAAGGELRSSVGTPIRGAASARSAPRVHRPRSDRGRVHDVVAQPDRAGKVDRLGAAVQHRLGADVDEHPADLGPSAACRRAGSIPRAPSRRGAGARRRSRCTGRQPAIPPPTTTTRRRSVCGASQAQVGKGWVARSNRAPMGCVTASRRPRRATPSDAGPAGRG